MILFVGGSRHGMEYVHTANGSAELDPAPPSFVDVQTAERYVLAPVSMTMLNPVTNLPVAVLERTVYFLDGLIDPQQRGMGLTDAVTRWWFQTHGTRKEPVAAQLAPWNGNALPPRYHARCEVCTEAEVFTSPGPRARWMQPHIDAGHAVRWTDDAPEESNG